MRIASCSTRYQLDFQAKTNPIVAKRWLKPEGQADVHRCKMDIDVHEDDHPMYPATLNDPKLHEYAENVLKLLLGPEKVKPCGKVMAGEDFAFYQQ
ncbi:hypothetical protein ARALYDRAFT_916547 [Arabidopsis lyrata subsp. lyrata]|uniref:Uncharacterized protein n=1 Tax=Arabidopsis lyrata subsp. lyrata TaxID=81972 RepID=D7MK36_ARALL|nr:hypothetical protein ARALYDRAFT_916547 [Arabidopsis lyrata subsp. lyrata]